MEPVTISVADACRALGIQRTKLYELLGSKQLDSIQIGRKRLITTESIHRLVSDAMQREVA